MSEVRTPRLLIRPILAEDRADMLRLLADKQVAQTYMLPDFPDEAAVTKLFERLRTLSGESAHYIRALILDGHAVGMVNDTEIADGTIELGWLLLPAFHGQGLMTEAVRAIIADLFTQGFAQVTAGAFEDNIASIRVMEKAGMRRMDGRTDLIDYRGKSRRCVYYAARRDE